MLELAQECKNIEVFNQVSTAYANCSQRGLISEKIYYKEGEQDFEEIIDQLMKMPKEQAGKETTRIID
jgi:hypothetical protein